MGAYCTLDSIRRHPARLGEIMEVRRISTYYDVAVFGDRGEIACIPHKGCLLEVVASGEATHPEVNQLPARAGDPVHAIVLLLRPVRASERHQSGTRATCRLQAAARAPRRAPLPEEDAVVRRVMREKLDVAETVTDTAVASPG